MIDPVAPTIGPDASPARPPDDLRALLPQSVRIDKAAIDDPKRLAAILEESQRIAKIGSWEWDIATNRIWDTATAWEIWDLPAVPTTATFQDFYDRIHPDDRDAVAEATLGALRSGSGYEIDHRIVRPDGSVRWINHRGRVYRDDAGALVRLAGTWQDITERRETEDALRESLDRLRAAADVKDAVLTAVSHELRTPLTVVFGAASTLEREDVRNDPDLVRELVARLLVQARRLATLITDLLDLDRLRRGVIEPHRREVEVLGLCRRAVGAVDAAHHRVSVSGRRFVAAIDAAQTERIVENLVANAARHTPPGTPIWVRAVPDGDAAHIVVEDAGPGVPDAAKASVFDVFWRGRASDHAPGAGVGLSLVARFAELHGGRAWVEDREGGGASFHVLLPAPAGSGAEPAAS